MRLPWMVYLISLVLPQNVKAANTSDQNGGLRLLVRKKGDSFVMISLAKNQSMDLWEIQPGTYADIEVSPSGKEVYFLMKNSTSRYIAKGLSRELRPLRFNFALRDCWHQLKTEKSEIMRINADFISGNLYFSTSCGEIYACNLNSLKCSEIYKLRALSKIKLVVYPEKGLLLWAENLLERAEGDEMRTIPRSFSIYRANMDGSSKHLVMNAFTGLHYFVLDRQHARMYMEFKDRLGLYVFDILGEQQPRIVPAFSSRELLAGKVLLHVSGNIFIWLVGFEDVSEVILSDEMKQVGNFSVLYQRSNDENYLEILPQGSFAESFPRSNPCLTKNCSHLCALSGPEDASCLCGRNEDLSLDQVTCTERYLLISTVGGVYRLALDGQSPVENWDILNASTPELVVHDPVNGELLWIEQNTGKGAARIYRRETVSGKISLALEVKFNESRLGPQAIQAMDVDWVTRNIYFTIQHEQRIRVCDASTKVCTEMLHHFVSNTVCNLELLPQIGKIFWVDVHIVGGTSMEKVYLNVAGMDGEGAEAIESYDTTGLSNCPCMAIDKANLSIYVAVPEPDGAYRVDTFDLEGHKYRSAYLQNRKYLPIHIYVLEGDLIWVGRPSHSMLASANETDVILKGRLKHDRKVFEDYESWTLARVTGLTIYRFSPNPMNSSYKERTRESHQCPGVRLLSKNGSFSCACPGGTKRSVDGLSCKKPEHFIIYGTERGHVFLKNDSSGPLPVPLNSSVFTVANGAKDNQLFWTNSSGNVYGAVLSVADTTTLIRAKELVQNRLFTPKQIEYDWVGDNIFALEGKGNVWACGCTTGACVRVVTQEHTLDGEVRFALDPKRGFLYRRVEGGKTIYRTAMDGTGGMKSETFGYVVHAMAVDEDDGLLYVADKGNSYRLGKFQPIPYNRISCFDFDTNEQTLLIRLSGMPERLKATNGYVFWSSYTTSKNTWSIFSCETKSGNGLEEHMSKSPAPFGRFVNFGVISQNLQHSKVCGGGLCSHICIPTVAGYMWCDCPMGFQLRSDGWICECANADHCDVSRNHQAENDQIPLHSNVVKSLHGDCGRNQFQCLTLGECIQMNQTCDGYRDCTDATDEGPRCNDVCETNWCSHNCTTSPLGPICICPIDQDLADDLANCTSKQETPQQNTSKQNTQNPRTESPVGFSGPVFGTLLAVLAVVCLVLAWKYLQAKRKLRDLTADEIREFIEGDSSTASLAPNGMDRAMMLPYKAILPPEGIVVDEKVLGSGEYGVVHSGVFNGQVVAIKKLKQRVDVDEFKAVLAEMKIMSYLGDHEHIIKFFGSDVSQIAHCQIIIVTELSPHGDLLHFLWKVGSEGLALPHNSVQLQTPQDSTVSVRTLYQWCEQIASGMEYLVTKQVIHGDLAARNVLVFDSNSVKIADFGMSKQLYGSGQYNMKKQKKLPWKWGSIELLTFGEFSEASDVWAFGVTAWEVFTLGETPYKKMMRFDTPFIEYLREGNRLPPPAHASWDTFALLLECWNAEVTSRPNFALLREFFHEQIQNIIQGEETGMASAH